LLAPSCQWRFAQQLFDTVWSGNHFALSTPVHSFKFLSVGFKNSALFSSRLELEIPSPISYHHILFDKQIFNQNKPQSWLILIKSLSIFLIQHHLICSHIAVICNGDTVKFVLKPCSWFLTNIKFFI